MIAGAADQVMQPGALAAQHEHAVSGQVELVVIAGSPLIEPDDP